MCKSCFIQALIAEHNGKGWVFVVKSDILLGVHWAEVEYSPETKDRFKKRGLLILKPGEVM